RAAARGHDLVARCDEGWAHDRGVLAATGTTIALLEIADKRAILERKGEHRLKWELERACEIFAQMIVDLVPAIAEDFSRIENVFRIERIFDFAHYFEQLIPDLLAHIFSARDANAVLSGERPFELPHERGRLICYLPEFFRIGRAMEIENRPNVEQSACSVPVITRFEAKRFHDRLQSAHVIGQLSRAN